MAAPVFCGNAVCKKRVPAELLTKLGKAGVTCPECSMQLYAHEDFEALRAKKRDDGSAELMVVKNGKRVPLSREADKAKKAAVADKVAEEEAVERLADLEVAKPDDDDDEDDEDKRSSSAPPPKKKPAAAAIAQKSAMKAPMARRGLDNVTIAIVAFFFLLMLGGAIYNRIKGI